MRSANSMESGSVKWEEQIPELRLSESSDEEADVESTRQKPQPPKVVEKVSKTLDNEPSTPTRLCSSENRHFSNVNLRPLPDDWMVDLSHEVDGQHFCDLCPAKEDKSFTSEIQLKKHLNLHHRLHRIEIHTRDDAAMSLPCFCTEDCKEPHYHCLFCGRKLVTACRYVTHLKNEHVQEKALTGLKEITPGENFQELVKDWPLDIPKLNGNCGDERRRSLDSRRESLSEIIGTVSPKRRYSEEQQNPPKINHSTEEKSKKDDTSEDESVITADKREDSAGDVPVEDTEEAIHQEMAEDEVMKVDDEEPMEPSLNKVPESKSVDDRMSDTATSDEEEMEIITEEEIAAIRNGSERSKKATTNEEKNEEEESDEDAAMFSAEEVAAAAALAAIKSCCSPDKKVEEGASVSLCNDSAMSDVLEAELENSTVDEVVNENKAYVSICNDSAASDVIEASLENTYSEETVESTSPENEASSRAMDEEEKDSEEDEINLAVEVSPEPDSNALEEEEKDSEERSLIEATARETSSPIEEDIEGTGESSSKAEEEEEKRSESDEVSLNISDDEGSESEVVIDRVHEDSSNTVEEDEKNAENDTSSKNDTNLYGEIPREVGSKGVEEEKDSEDVGQKTNSENVEEERHVSKDVEEDLAGQATDESVSKAIDEEKEVLEDAGMDLASQQTDETSSKNVEEEEEVPEDVDMDSSIPKTEETGSKDIEEEEEDADMDLAGQATDETISKDIEEEKEVSQAADMDLACPKPEEVSSKDIEEEKEVLEDADMNLSGQTTVETSSKNIGEKEVSEDVDMDLADQATGQITDETSSKAIEEKEVSEDVDMDLADRVTEETSSKNIEEKETFDSSDEESNSKVAEEEIRSSAEAPAETRQKTVEENKEPESDDIVLTDEETRPHPEQNKDSEIDVALTDEASPKSIKEEEERSKTEAAVDGGKDETKISENDKSLGDKTSLNTSVEGNKSSNDQVTKEMISKASEEKCLQSNTVEENDLNIRREEKYGELGSETLDTSQEKDSTLEDSVVTTKDDSMTVVKDILKDYKETETLRCLPEEHKSKKEASESEGHSVSEDEENTAPEPEIEYPLREIPKDFADNPKSPEAVVSHPAEDKRGGEQVLAEREQNVNSAGNSMCDKLIEFEDLSDSDHENRLRIDESRPKKKTPSAKKKEKKRAKQPTPKKTPKKEEENNTEECSTDYIEKLIEKIDGLYKCKLCAKHGKITTEDVALAHVKNVHMKYKQVIQNKWLCLPCFRYCGESRGEEHFHCPTCLLTYANAVALDAHCANECTNISRPEQSKKSSKATPKKQSKTPQKKAKQDVSKKPQESLKKVSDGPQPTKKPAEQNKKVTEPSKKPIESSKKVSESSKKVSEPLKKVTGPPKTASESVKKHAKVTESAKKGIDSLKRTNEASTKTSDTKKSLDRSKSKETSGKQGEPEVKKLKYESNNKKSRVKEVIDLSESPPSRSKRKASESLPSEKPQKMQKTDVNLTDELPTEQITRLIEALPGEFRCRLCPSILSFKEQEQVIVHVNMKHVKHKLSLHGKWFCLPCLRDCFSADSSSHFHCPVCSETFGTAKAITLHAEDHLKQSSKKKISLPPKKKSIGKFHGEIPLSDEDMVTRAANFLYNFDTNRKTYSCELCPQNEVCCKTMKDFKHHVHSCHVKYKVITGAGGSCLPCLKNCGEITSMHYHCPHCMDPVSDSSNFLKHLLTHPEMMEESSKNAEPSNKSMRIKAKENKLKQAESTKAKQPTPPPKQQPTPPPKQQPTPKPLPTPPPKQATPPPKQVTPPPKHQQPTPSSKQQPTPPSSKQQITPPSSKQQPTPPPKQQPTQQQEKLQKTPKRPSLPSAPLTQTSPLKTPPQTAASASKKARFSPERKPSLTSLQSRLEVSSVTTTEQQVTSPKYRKCVAFNKLISVSGSTYTCTLCPPHVTFSDSETCREHIVSSHISQNVRMKDNVVCLPCLKACDGEVNSHAHFHCPTCMYKCDSKETLHSHVVVHQSEAMPPSTPQPVGASTPVGLPVKRKLDDSRVTQVPVDQIMTQHSGLYWCKFCVSSSFSSRNKALVNHVETMHSNYKVIAQKKYLVLPCYKHCDGVPCVKVHYHCPLCEEVIHSNDPEQNVVSFVQGMFTAHLKIHESSTSDSANQSRDLILKSPVITPTTAPVTSTPIKEPHINVSSKDQSANVSVEEEKVIDNESYETMWYLCGDAYICKLCKQDFPLDEMSRLVSHIKTEHIDETVVLDHEQRCMPFKKVCKKVKDEHNHYLCPMCTTVICTKPEFLLHAYGHGCSVSRLQSNAKTPVKPASSSVRNVSVDSMDTSEMDATRAPVYPDLCSECSSRKGQHCHCDACQFIGDTKDDVFTHKKNTHEAAVPEERIVTYPDHCKCKALNSRHFHCSVCEFISKKSAAMLQHKKLHTSTNQSTQDVSGTSSQDTSSLSDPGTLNTKPVNNSYVGPCCSNIGITGETLKSGTLSEIPRDGLTNGVVMELRRYCKYLKINYKTLRKWVCLLCPAAARISLEAFEGQVEEKWAERMKIYRVKSKKEAFDSEIFKMEVPLVEEPPTQEETEEPVRHFESVSDLSQTEDDPARKNAIARLKKHQLLKLATEKDGRFTCQLCPKSFSTGTSPEILQHILKQHVSRGVIDATRLVLPCLRDCIKDGGKSKLHYHCTECKAAIVDKTEFLAHTSKHRESAPPVKTSPAKKVGRGRMMHAECEGGGPHCQKFFAGSKGGNKEECCHMKLVGMDSQKLDVVALKEGAIKEISASSAMRKQCEDLMAKARQLSRPVICELPGKSPLCFSVWLGGKLDGFQLERGLTQAEPSSSQVWCQVCSSSVCLHRCITWAYITQRQYVTGGRMKCSGRLDEKEVTKAQPEKDASTVSEKSSPEIASTPQPSSAQTEARRSRGRHVNEVMEDDADIKLSYISAELRAKVPVDAIMPSEMIIPPAEGLSLDCDPRHTTHIDAFLYDDGLIDELWASGAMSRGYCVDCGSNNTRPLTLLTHSCSKQRLRYIFKALLPPLKDRVVLDVGSRLGAVLFGAHVYSTAKKIIGVEVNEELVRMTRSMVVEQGMQDRIQIYLGDIRSHAALVKQAHVIVLNNVFEWFLNVKEQSKVWEFLYKNVKPGTMLVCSPSLPKTMQTIKMANISSGVTGTLVTLSFFLGVFFGYKLKEWRMDWLKRRREKLAQKLLQTEKQIQLLAENK